MCARQAGPDAVFMRPGTGIATAPLHRYCLAERVGNVTAKGSASRGQAPSRANAGREGRVVSKRAISLLWLFSGSALALLWLFSGAVRCIDALYVRASRASLGKLRRAAGLACNLQHRPLSLSPVAIAVGLPLHLSRAKYLPQRRVSQRRTPTPHVLRAAILNILNSHWPRHGNKPSTTPRLSV